MGERRSDEVERMRRSLHRYREEAENWRTVAFRDQQALRQIINGGAPPWVQRIARAALYPRESGMLDSGRGK